MPGLLDLPPELIEQIFELTEEYVLATKARPEQSWDLDMPRNTQQVKAPVFRCTNRYIERATRRLFIGAFFHSWHIKAADDHNIQKFCTVVRTSDVLVKGLEELNIYVDDDRMIPKHHERLKSEGSADEDITHVFDNDTASMVPVAYFQNRNQLVSALSACKNIHSLYFHRNLERGELPQMPANAVDDSVQEGQRGQVSPSDNGSEGDDDDIDITSDAELVPGGMFWVPLEKRWFDVTTSLIYVLSLAGVAGTRLRCISTKRDNMSLADCAGLTKHKRVLRNLEQMHLTVDYDPYWSMKDPKRVTRLGKHLRESLESMPALRKLTLILSHGDGGVDTWSHISKTAPIANLEELAIAWFKMHFEDFADFVLKHGKTLKALDLKNIHWPDGNTWQLGAFYGGLSMAQNLEQIHQRYCYFGRDGDFDDPDIPNHLLSPEFSHTEDEDGYTFIWTESTIHHEGKDKVNAVLKELAASMCSK